jgi:SAM-dependent methyltransferase
MDAPTTCRICGGELELAWPGGDLDVSSHRFAPSCHQPGEHGDLYRCHECGTVFQPALPGGADLHSLYRDMEDGDYLAEEEGRRATSRRLLDLVAAQVPAGGSLLDVGCGHGLLTDEARKRGFAAEGVELSDDAVRYVRDVLQLPVLHGTLDDPALDGRTFDAIVMADVIEHLEDPGATLDRCAELLAPGGALLVVTPDPSSPVARLAGGRWWGYLPAHTFLFPRRTLRELIAARGLVIAEDVSFVRSFTPGYWVSGAAERGGKLGASIARLCDRLPDDRLLSLSLGDERVVLATKTQVQQPEHTLVTDRGGPVKVHVVLPAYKASRTVQLVADTLPVDAADRALLVDDHSPDDTVDAALAAGFEVLRTPTNRGYGANQKTCYVRAALDGADVVVMVHADNQYDPGLLAQIAQPIVDGEADVVIGSRLLEDEAISGGMPRWKWVGNRGLTWAENQAFGCDFSEYHTGYRAFSVDFLRTIPFLRNADGFVFDQEIFAQVVNAGARVQEVAIPTRYFLEASSVSFTASVEYGLRTLGVLARYKLDQKGRRWPLLRKPAAKLAGPREPVH